MEDVTPIGCTNWRNEHRRFGIKDADRLRHIYCLGGSGTGKSTLLENMVISDVRRGKGLGVIDPHGDIAERLLNHIPKERVDDLLYFNAADVEFPIGYNPLNGVSEEMHHLVASNLVATFKKVWADSWGPRLEYILKFSILTLLAYPGATLLHMRPLLTNPLFRSKVLSHVSNEHVASFWQNEFDKYTPAMRSEAISPILNKVGVFLTSLPLQNIVGQPRSSFSFRDLMDQQKIFIANLSKGRIGEDATSVLGSMLLSGFQLAALSRADQPEDVRMPFYLYIDEVQSFLTLAFVDILAEARKFGISMFITHQYIEQLDEKIRSGILGNVGTIIIFRLGPVDAEHMRKEFEPTFRDVDLVNLPAHSIYLKLLIDGMPSKPFSAVTAPTPPIAQPKVQELIQRPREKFGMHKGFPQAAIKPDSSLEPKSLFDSSPGL